MNKSLNFTFFYNHIYLKSAKSLKKQIKTLNFQTNIFPFRDLDVIKIENSPINSKDLYNRGVGYWSWKPFIILNTLNQLKENDYLFYIDSGCHVRNRGGEKIEEYINFLDQNNILCFESDKQTSGIKSIGKISKWLEINWTKKELLDYFNIDEKKSYRPQRIATIIGFKNTKLTQKFLKEWTEIASIRNLIDDTLILKQYKEFIENRHDQSIFSLLTYKYNLQTLSNREIELPGQFKLIETIKLFKQPFIAKRDKRESNIKKIKRLILKYF